MADVIRGAEAMSVAGNGIGVLFVHGYTGSPSSLRAMAVAAEAEGYTVELPRLAGHGTSIDDLMATSWSDWTSDVLTAHDELRSRVEHLVVVALSAGGGWTAWLAMRRRLDGVMFVNPFVLPLPAELAAQASEAIAAGIEVAPGDGPDIAKPCVEEVAYGGTPLRPLMTIHAALDEVSQRLHEIDVPVLIATSPQDHVIDPVNSRELAARVTGPKRTITLEESYHVATQDHDQGLLITEMLSFIKEVAS